MNQRKLKRCCAGQELHKDLLIEAVESHSQGVLIGIRKFGRLILLDYCPWCGKKLEVEK